MAMSEARCWPVVQCAEYMSLSRGRYLKWDSRLREEMRQTKLTCSHAGMTFPWLRYTPR